MITYSHQLLAVVLVHPEQKMVLPLAPEPIGGRATDGVQDSELKAAHRWLTQFRRFHPKLVVVFLGDACTLMVL